MITKTLRNKIIAGAVVFSMVGGLGTVFATSDAGAQLESWYNNTRFPQAVAKVTNDVTAYAKTLVGGLFSWLGETKNGAVAAVTKAGTDEEARANGAINGALKEHKDSITAKQSEIENAMPKLFDDNVAKANLQVDDYAGKGVSIANGQIKPAVDKQGKDSLGGVTTNVGATKEAAVADLTSAIKAAKDSISGKVDTEVATATGEINKHIDDKIAETKPLVESAADTLVGAKKTSIEAEGQKIEGQAKDAMDALVEGITEE